jgi:hypothetical protein
MTAPLMSELTARALIEDRTRAAARHRATGLVGRYEA